MVERKHEVDFNLPDTKSLPQLPVGQIDDLLGHVIYIDHAHSWVAVSAGSSAKVSNSTYSAPNSWRISRSPRT
jgi:hypothetical protein